MKHIKIYFLSLSVFLISSSPAASLRDDIKSACSKGFTAMVTQYKLDPNLLKSEKKGSTEYPSKKDQICDQVTKFDSKKSRYGNRADYIDLMEVAFDTSKERGIEGACLAGAYEAKKISPTEFKLQKVDINLAAYEACVSPLRQGERVKRVFNYENGKKRTESNFIKHNKELLSHGDQKRWNDKGNLISWMQYKNGVRYGYQRRYSNGDLTTEEMYKNGIRNGSYKRLSKNKLQEEGFYKNGKKDRTWNYYTDKGQKKYIKTYKNGDLNGPYHSWRISNDSRYKDIETNYKAGKKHGKHTEFYPSSKPKTVSHYKNGKKNGKHLEYYSNAQLKIKTHYLNNKRNEEYVEYNKDGTLDRKGVYKNGKQSGNWMYYKDGEVSRQKNYN